MLGECFLVYNAQYSIVYKPSLCIEDRLLNLLIKINIVSKSQRISKTIFINCSAVLSKYICLRLAQPTVLG